MKSPPISNFFQSHEGTSRRLSDRHLVRALLRARDRWYDLRISMGGALRKLRSASGGKPARVLIVGIEVPSRASDIHDTVARLRQNSRHDITVSVTPMKNRGKFANIDASISAAAAPLESFDWLVITDDDIAFRPGLLDDMIDIAHASDFALSQPSHAFLSYSTYSVTLRRYGSLARRTNFVEIGPLTLVRSDMFEALIPFPPSRWCYGIDLLWSVEARRKGRRIGIIDGTPVRHLRAVAASYDIDAARLEGEELIAAHGVTDDRVDLFGMNIIELRA